MIDILVVTVNHYGSNKIFFFKMIKFWDFFGLINRSLQIAMIKIRSLYIPITKLEEYSQL